MILGASILQFPAIKKAIEMNLDVVVVDMNPNAIGFSMEGIEKEYISTIDIESIIVAAKKHKINGIMTLATDMPMRAVATVAKEMNLRGISVDTAIKATNKYEMRKALKEYNVPIPKFYKASSKSEYNEIIKTFESKCIVKPVDSSGSRGIYLINDINNEKIIDEAYEYSHKYSRNGDVLIEEYMEGSEVSVETISIDGVCNVIQITDKLTTGAPHFVEMGHSQPTRFNNGIASQIAKVAEMANKAIGINNGPSHTEIIVTSEGPKIVELGARLGGDNITTHLVPLSTGVDMVESCIKIALGDNPDITKKYDKGSAIRYFKQKDGIIKSIEGIENARQIDGIKEISFVHNIGEKITDIESSSSRLGFVIAQGENAEDAIKKCEQAEKLIDIDIKEEK